MINKLLIIGGDIRQLYMSYYLESLGYEIYLYGLPETSRKCEPKIKEAMKITDVIIFPLPITKDGKHVFSITPVKETLDEIINLIDAEKIVFAGMIDRGTKTKLSNKKIKYYDYFEREDVTVMNTVPTVQGILKVIIDNVDYTIHSSKCAVFGYGRVAKVTAEALKSLGADVTICARKNGDLASARINGMNSCLISDFTDDADKYNFIVNTVPSQIIDRNILSSLKSDCMIIDVASSPYGTDFAAANELGIKAMQCPSLPGKVAPKTAGKIIADGILNIIKEENYG